MKVSELISVLIRVCDPDADVMVEGLRWTGTPGQSNLMSGGIWPAAWIELGKFASGDQGLWVKIRGSDAWMNGEPVGSHE